MKRESSGAFEERRAAPRAGGFAAVAALAVAAVLALASVAQAQAQRAVADSAAIQRPSAVTGQTPGAARDTAAYVMPPLGKAMVDHLHNKVVHFPVALTLVAALLVWGLRGRPDARYAAHIVIRLAALAAVVAYFSGRAQVEDVEHGPMGWVVEIHEQLGTATALSLLIWAGLTFPAWGRRYVGWWALVCVTLVSVAAFYGGVVAHGRP